MRLTAVEEGHLRNGLPGTIGIAAVFPGARFDLAQVRSRVQERWGGLDRMGLVVEPPTGPSALLGHRWAVGRPFDPAAHITATDQELESVFADGVVTRCRPDGPPGSCWSHRTPSCCSPITPCWTAGPWRPSSGC